MSQVIEHSAAETLTQVSTEDVAQQVLPGQHVQDSDMVNGGPDTEEEQPAAVANSDCKPASDLTGSSCTMSLSKDSQVRDCVNFYGVFGHATANLFKLLLID